MYNNDLYTGEAQALEIAENGLGSLLNVKSPLPLSNVSSSIQSISKGSYLFFFLFLLVFFFPFYCFLFLISEDIFPLLCKIRSGGREMNL